MLQSVKRNNQVTQVVPLKNVTIHSTIRSFAADVTIKQIFRNDEATPIEAVYCFPIEEQAAIYSFVACIDDREIIAEIKEKKAAQQDYTKALEQGHGAYLMEQDKSSHDNFIINVGALLPSKECTITISYVTELDLVQGSIIRFVVPTTIAPRYNPDKCGIASPAGTNAQYVQNSLYTIELCCQVENVGGRQIARINSSSHPIEIDLAQEDRYTVKFVQTNTHLDRDILINIELAEKCDSLIATIEPGAIMATFIPTEYDCQRVTKFGSEASEFIFIVDCSGSMINENKIGLAREATLLFLKSLPMSCYFNIIRFGSRYVALFNEITAIYSEDNARQAEALVKSMQADLDGTELLKPLAWLEQHPPTQGRSRQIFLLTDGEISNVTEVLDLCRSMALSTRIFSFGLGQSPSRSLVKGLARSTNGRFVFIPPSTPVDVAVGEQLQKSLQRYITNAKVKWNINASIVTTVPNQLSPVYAKDRLIVYGLLDNKFNPFDHNSSVELQVDQQQLCIARITQIPSISENEMIARLAAKALILELQHTKLPAQITTIGSRQSRFYSNLEEPNDSKISELKEIEKKRIIELSLKYNVLSPYTAFVGVDKRIDGNNVQMVLREVPIQISADDQHLQRFNYKLSAAPKFSMCNTASSYERPRGGSGKAFRGRGGYATNSLIKERRLCCEIPITAPLFQQQCQPISSMPIPMPKSIRKSRSRSRSRSPQNRQRFNLNFSVKNELDNPTQVDSSEWPSNDQDIVRHLIDKQSFNGLWHLDIESIQHLTGISLADFQSIHDDVAVITTAIILILLETRFGTFVSMWYGVAQKARTIIIEKLDKDPKNLSTLLDNIRKRL